MHAYQPHYPNHIFKLLFLCELVGGEAKDNIEISEIDFFENDNLPELSTERVLEEDIALLWRFHHGQESLVYCD